MLPMVFEDRTFDIKQWHCANASLATQDATWRARRTVMKTRLLSQKLSYRENKQI